MKTGRSKLCLRMLMGLLLTLGLGGTLVLFLLQTEVGLNLLASQLSRILSSDTLRVQLGHVRAVWPANVSVGEIALADAKGTWLTLQGLDVELKVRPLLSRHIVLSKLKVRSMDVPRMPTSGKGSGHRSVISLPEFRVESVVLEKMELGADVCGRPVAVRGISGQVQGASGANEAQGRFAAAAERIEWGGAGVDRVSVDVKFIRRGDEQWSLELLEAGMDWGKARLVVEEPCRVNREGVHYAVRGALRATALDLRVFSNAVPGNLEGIVTAGMRVSGTLAAPEFSGEITCTGLTSADHTYTNLPSVNGVGQFTYSNGVLSIVTDVTAHTGNVARITISVPGQVSLMPWSMRMELNRLMMESDIRFGHFSFGALKVATGSLSVRGQWGALSVAGTAGGILGEKPLALDMGGKVTWDESRLDLGFSRVTVEYAGIQAILAEPLQISMRSGSNVISAAWHAEVEDLATASNLISRGVKGGMQADFRVGGTLLAPEIGGRVVCKGFVAPWYGLSSLSAVSGTGEVGLSNGFLNASLTVGLATGGVVKAALQAPVNFSIQPWRFHPIPDRPLSAVVDAGLNLAILNSLDIFANGRIGGRLQLALAYNGSLASGVVTGTCDLVDGEYENFLLGTVIRGAQVKFVAQDQMLRIEDGRASDGGGGHLTCAGAVKMDPARGFPYVLELGCQKARLLRRPDVEAKVTGRLGLEGALSWIRASGKMQIDEALVELMNIRPPPPESLGAVSAGSVSKARASADTNISMRLELDIPGNLYVRGKSLDSAWSGNLVLAYNGSELGLSGYLEPRRGSILLLKRPFKISEGRIEFSREWPPDPSLRLLATYSRSDLQAEVSIMGKMGNPEIVLSSEPALPEDEILARILFGKDMSTVTPLQAISLASEAAKLRKMGGGTGIMGDVREAVGIDRVEFREAGEGAASPEVAAGKYLGDRSYVEMRRTTSTEQSGQTQLFLEHELRPNIVLEAESGVEMRSGVGIFWKMDY